MVFKITTLLVNFVIFIALYNQTEAAYKVNQLENNPSGLVRWVSRKYFKTKDGSFKPDRLKRQVDSSTNANGHENALRDLLLRFKEDVVSSANLVSKTNPKYRNDSKIIKYVITPSPVINVNKSIEKESTDMNQNMSESKIIKIIPQVNLTSDIRNNESTKSNDYKEKILTKIKDVKNKLLNFLKTNKTTKLNGGTVTNIVKTKVDKMDSDNNHTFINETILNDDEKSVPQLEVIYSVPVRVFSTEKESSSTVTEGENFKPLFENKSTISSNAIYAYDTSTVSSKMDSKNNSNFNVPSTTAQDNLHTRTENEFLKPNTSSNVATHESNDTKNDIEHENAEETHFQNITNNNVTILHTSNGSMKQLKHDLENVTKSIENVKEKATNDESDESDYLTRRVENVPVKIMDSEQIPANENEEEYAEIDSKVDNLKMELEKLLENVSGRSTKPPFVPVNELNEASAVNNLRALSKDGLLFSDHHVLDVENI